MSSSDELVALRLFSVAYRVVWLVCFCFMITFRDL